MHKLANIFVEIDVLDDYYRPLSELVLQRKITDKDEVELFVKSKRTPVETLWQPSKRTIGMKLLLKSKAFYGNMDEIFWKPKLVLETNKAWSFSFYSENFMPDTNKMNVKMKLKCHFWWSCLVSDAVTYGPYVSEHVEQTYKL